MKMTAKQVADKRSGLLWKAMANWSYVAWRRQNVRERST